MKWLEINVSTLKEKEDKVSGILYDIGAKALDIEDPNDLIDLYRRDDEWDFFGIDIKDVDLEKINIKSYFSEEEDLDSILLNVKDKIEKTDIGIVTTSEIEDEDYLNNWKEYFKTFRVGEKIIIKPSWEEYEEEKGDIIIDIDPGMAFGTGTHETTSLCIKALEEHIKVGDTIFDVGCGSGILSIVSAKLGAGKVSSIDLDPTCVKISKENIRKNNLQDKIEVRHGDLLKVIDEKADIIVANIIAEVIVDLTSDIREYLKDRGIFISSGIILRKKEKVLEALKSNNFKIEDIKTKGEWVSIVAIKK